MAVESSEIQRGEYLPRVADGLLTQALQSSGAVQIKGPKWCGKTATAERQSASQVFMQDPDRSATLLALADTKPSLILRGEEPRLIDEWQMAPQLWDAVRFAIDRGRGRGRFILTGSATPQQEPAHSGVGRIARLTMRTMSLFESQESTGVVSLGELFDGNHDVSGFSDFDIESGMGAEGKIHFVISQIFYRVGDCQRFVFERIFHRQGEIERIYPAGFFACFKTERRLFVGCHQNLKLAFACKSMLGKIVFLVPIGKAVRAEPSDNRKENRGLSAPYGRFALPKIFTSGFVVGNAGKLRAVWLDFDGELSVFQYNHRLLPKVIKTDRIL